MWHPRGRTNYQPHCGGCSQCVDRRFGTRIADLTQVDWTEYYGIDIFRDELPEGEARTIATGYLRLAQKLNALAPEQIFSEYQELYDCLDASNEDIRSEAAEIADLLKRHAQSVVAAMESEVAAAAPELLRGDLPPTCLIRLAIGASEVTTEAAGLPAGLEVGQDFATVSLKGETYALSAPERVAFKLLYEVSKRGQELSGKWLAEQANSSARGASELFRKSRLWNHVVVPGSRRGLCRIVSNDSTRPS
jgi:hypothetical protein